jgi:hypothetical protein
VPPPPTSPPAPDSVSVNWNNGIPGAVFTIIDQSARLQKGEFCWTPTQDKISNLPYTFTVTARDNACPINGITSRTYRVYVTDGTTGINKVKKIPLTLFPNPTSENINVKQVMDHISITDALGREIIKLSNQSRIDIQELQLGIYYVECIKGETIFIGKFVKE